MPKVHGFPIVDKDNKLVGLVTRESLMVLLKKQCWIERDLNSQIALAELQEGKNLNAYRSMAMERPKADTIEEVEEDEK